MQRPLAFPSPCAPHQAGPGWGPHIHFWRRDVPESPLLSRGWFPGRRWPGHRRSAASAMVWLGLQWAPSSQQQPKGFRKFLFENQPPGLAPHLDVSLSGRRVVFAIDHEDERRHGTDFVTWNRELLEKMERGWPQLIPGVWGAWEGPCGMTQAWLTWPSWMILGLMNLWMPATRLLGPISNDVLVSRMAWHPPEQPRMVPFMDMLGDSGTVSPCLSLSQSALWSSEISPLAVLSLSPEQFFSSFPESFPLLWSWYFLWLPCNSWCAGLFHTSGPCHLLLTFL